MVECKAATQDEVGLTPLMRAASSGEQATAEELLLKSADVTASDKDGATALHFAAKSGSAPVVELLLRQQAPVSCAPCPAGTPLHWALSAGDMAVIALLLDACPALVHAPDATGRTPLHASVTAGHPDLALFLLERGADPNVLNATGGTPLHLAAAAGALEAVRHLLTFGATLLPDGAGRTPLELAADSSVRKELQRKADGLYDLTEEKRAQKADMFKAQGNKVFQAGEYSKSAKFYTLAIAHSPRTAALFSNRSASYYNLRRLPHALADASHCIALQPEWPKGYFRKGATLVLLDRFADARATFEAGLKRDPKNADLKGALADLDKAVAKRGH
jgi:hypothetical protein